MKKILYMCALTTTACLSLSTAYSSDYLSDDNRGSRPRSYLADSRRADLLRQDALRRQDILDRNEALLRQSLREKAMIPLPEGNFLYSADCEYDRLNKAKQHLQQYYESANVKPNITSYGRIENTYYQDKELAKKISNHMDAATQLIFDNDVRIIGHATKETNDWYLNFVRMKAQNLEARFDNDLTVFSVGRVLEYEFNVKEVDNETLLEKDPVVKLHFQLGVLISCCLFGPNNIEKIFKHAYEDPYFANFKNTLKGLEGFIGQLQDIELPVKFAQVQAIYRDETQKDIKAIKKLTFLKAMPPLVFSPEIYEIEHEKLNDDQLVLKRRLLYAKWELDQDLYEANGNPTLMEIAKIDYARECDAAKKHPNKYWRPQPRWGKKF